MYGHDDRNISVPALCDGWLGGLAELLDVAAYASHFPLRILLGQLLAPVMGLATTSEPDFDFGPAVLEVHLEGNDGEWLLGRLFLELVNLPAVDQELASAIRIVRAESHRKDPRRDVGTEEPEFTVFHAGVAVPDLSPTLTQALYFAARQDHAALEGVDNFVVVPRTAIGGYDAIALVVGLGRSASLLHSFRTGHPSMVQTSREIGRSLGRVESC